MAYETLKSIITQNIKTNGQESITGAILQQILLRMVDELGYTPAGEIATKEWVNTQLSDYASQTWVNNKLADYLPLTGGNLDGNLSIYDTMNIYSSSIEWNDNGDYCRIAFDIDGITVTANGTGYVIANGFIKNGGTSAQVLCADGSVKTLAELKAALNAI